MGERKDRQKYAFGFFSKGRLRIPNFAAHLKPDDLSLHYQ